VPPAVIVCVLQCQHAHAVRDDRAIAGDNVTQALGSRLIEGNAAAAIVTDANSVPFSVSIFSRFMEAARESLSKSLQNNCGEVCRSDQSFTEAGPILK
jgi:hypothetical protein